MTRGLRLTAVAALVVVALTGFSSGRGRGHHHSSGSGGGGCSSSSQDHDSSSSSSSSGGSSGSGYDDDDDSGTVVVPTVRPRHRTPTPTSTSSGSGSSVRQGTARLIKCADEKTPYATVEVTNPNDKTVRYDIHVAFLDSSGDTINALFHEVRVPAQGKVTTKVPVGGDDPNAVVDHCEVDPETLFHS
ncbi:hypothetical protein [Streptomyces sp. VRA16 Mangrove soil]|uniref:hypothetical protein n=1 Tax=Streptomyces sp. VRA16 Mangrove soil TaxID=2817434 RepID=UPI001A9FA8BC|nr:hypothetical protein [Streptomyces sp. VRA16 Mangrove soil]MBO1337848.1 hypothetical protein [Streptomyces sp. VRA16 Mangrove soil]